MSKKRNTVARVRPSPSPSSSRRGRGLLVLAVVLVAGAALWFLFLPRPLAPAPHLGEAAFVSDKECASCHGQQTLEWAGSHHAKAMQAATPATVLGSFDDVTLESRKAKWRFFKRDGKFWVNAVNAAGKPQDFEVKYTFGVDPLQQYLVEFPGGRMQALTVAWDCRPREKGGQRWYDLYPDQDLTPDDPLHWTGRYQNWNLMCAQCHLTNFKKGYDAEKDVYASTWSEGNVGCQACHGAGSRHMEWARATPRVPGSDKGLTVDYRARDNRYQVDSCAACHSRRSNLADPARIDAPLLDSYLPAVLSDGLYHPDGQQLGEVYAYGSFRQSKMYHQGVRCTDCHSAHGSKLLAPGNTVCLQCHQSLGNPRFPTLQKKEYDAPEHHHHKPGILCAGCHMPNTTYMGVHERPDHSMRIPRPDLTAALGVPNACNKCHADKTTAWSVEWTDKWYGQAWRQRPQFAAVFAAARTGDARAGGPLAAIVADAAQPAIVRATALDLLRPYPQAAAAALPSLAADDPVVRVAAASCLQVLPPADRVAPLFQLLGDAVLAVRAEAARQLAAARESLDPAQRKRLDEVLAEYGKEQMAMADMPSGRLNMGAMYADLGNRERAVTEYQAALRLDPFFLPATFNLANTYNAMGRNGEAERVLRDALKRAPREGELHYSLGLLLGEENRLADAGVALGKAAELLPNRARVQYNYGLALMQLGKGDAAEKALLAADRIDPNDRQVLYALASFYGQQKQWEKAQGYAERLLVLDPKDKDAANLMVQIVRARGKR